MIMVTMRTAKTNLSQLVAIAEAGEEVIISRNSVPAVRLVPVSARNPRRMFGALADSVFVSDAFFDVLPDEELSEWNE